ncbi:MAG TPA: DUF58 domain-containing protein [Mycobacteriales bacterium]|nr:DUF58 domain-containing protein [Mycobacteriales bacterium]
MSEPSRAGRLTDQVRRLPRPTRATSLLLTIAVILELLGQLINSTGVAIAAAAAVGAVIADAFLAPGVTFAEVDRRTPSRMAVGVEAAIQLSVRGCAKRTSGRRPVVLKDRPPGLDVGRYVVPAMRNGEHAIAERTAIPERRGCWPHGGRLDIEAYSPLGGWVRRNQVLIPESGWVHPAPATPLRLPESSAGEIYGRTSMSRSGAGHDFYGIREWRPGDATTAVHWRASARRNQLVVMERERPGHPTLVVVAGPLRDDDDGEALLARVAATAVQALRDGRGVILAGAGAVTSATRPTDALDWFAGLDPDGDPDGATLRRAMQAAGAGATVLWLGADPMPAALVGVARGAGAGSVTAASQLAGGTR